MPTTGKYWWSGIIMDDLIHLGGDFWEYSDSVSPTSPTAADAIDMYFGERQHHYPRSGSRGPYFKAAELYFCLGPFRSMARPTSPLPMMPLRRTIESHLPWLVRASFAMVGVHRHSRRRGEASSSPPLAVISVSPTSKPPRVTIQVCLIRATLSSSRTIFACLGYPRLIILSWHALHHRRQ